ncbi:MAG: glycoside hydrolase [Acidobacteria bacterium]|nr:MAG: glycoside hydrolase [Acidobacteriota bacterium]
MAQTYLMLLWHMHQPFYKDLAEGVYMMPWVRLHALKDYYGMVAILEEFPSVHVTFNLVPSLLAQLEEYGRDAAREDDYRIAFEPVDHLTAAEKARLLVFAFQLNRENLLNRHPRFRELFERVRGIGSPGVAARLLTAQDYLDLQVLSQLAWFDEIYLARDSEVRRLVKKQRGFSEQDKASLRLKEIEIFKVMLEAYAKAEARGQIEISTSPFYHPILPLLSDSAVAAESHPGVRLPSRRFRRPEDARAQIGAAVEFHARLFGRPPRGMWPSEGSLSDEVLRLASEEGVEWSATDEGVLGRSLGKSFERRGDGTVSNGSELYRPHRFSGGKRPVTLFFRDHQLSDLIGFVYSRMPAGAAAEDLHRRIHAAARSTGERPAVVSIILDGENAWEFFPGNGREFLRAFYGRIASDPGLRALTASEAAKAVEPGTLAHIVPGSWINANFDVWIGAEEDNLAWDLLAEAREFFDANAHHRDPAKVELARQELWIAEGSDWCWWYGPEHSSAHDEEFDLLYRKHLSNIYRLLDASPPDELAVPIKRPRVDAALFPPTGLIEPVLDGRVTNYFEWLGAGVYSPDFRSGSMHGAVSYLECLYYGYSDRALYLRLDFSTPFLATHTEFEVRVSVNSKSHFRLHAKARAGKVASMEARRDEVKLEVPPGEHSGFAAAFERIFEVRLDFATVGLASGEETLLQVSLWVNDLPVQVIPQEGWLKVELTRKFIVW